MLNNFKLDGPWRITFDTNPDQCNLKCIMCEEHSRYNISKDKTMRIMNFDLIEKVIKNCINYGLREVIPSTMGEPLLYKNFQDLLNLIEKNGLKLNLTTNGTFPFLGAEKWGRLILPIASDVKISINGATDKINESIMVGIKSKKQIANIESFVEVRNQLREQGINNPTVTFQATYLKRNIIDLPELLRYAIEMNVDRFKGHHLWVIHNQLARDDLRRNEASIKKWNKIVEELESIAENNRLKNGDKIKLENVYKLPFNGESKSIPDDYICPFLGREAWIAWDGTFNVCCAPNDLRGTLGDFGNINETPFMDLWNSKTYMQLINDWGSYDVCKSCNMRRKITQAGVCSHE